MPDYIVIADDLTGALDTAVQFVSVGVAARVFRYQPELLDTMLAPGVGDCGGGAVTVFDIASRHLPADQAAQRVKQVVIGARRAATRDRVTRDREGGGDRPRFYKKTDSALRGNVGSELNALLSASGADLICFVPAHPQLGRTTVNGVQMINGRPLAESEFGRDTREPVAASAVAGILAQQTPVPAQLVTTSEVYRGKPLDRHPQRVVICDAETLNDLDAVADWITQQNLRYELAGCGGFAGQISGIWKLDRTNATAGISGGASGTGGAAALGASPASDRPAELSEVASRGMLLVCGSMHPRSRAQARHALESGVFTRNRTAGAYFSVVMTEEDSGADPDAIARKLAGAALRQMRAHPPGVLAVFGGDTAAAVLDALEVRTILPVYEFAGGVVVSVIDSGVLPETRLLVSKAGGFGEEELVIDMYRQFDSLVARGLQCGLR